MKISDKSFALNFYFELPGTLDWGRFNKTYLLEEKRKDPIHKPIILKNVYLPIATWVSYRVTSVPCVPLKAIRIGNLQAFFILFNLPLK